MKDLVPKPMKVLIADDQPVARKVLTTFLTNEKYEVVVAEDGASALVSALKLTEPYIAILDWMMPGMSGPQVCACMRSTKRKIRPYVIMLSSRSDKGDIATALDAGADDYLSKPFNHGELMARLRVATRALQYQVDLHQQIEELESLVQRYNLLGEIVAQPGEIRSTGSASTMSASKSQLPQTQLSRREADAIMHRVFAELRLGHAEIVPTDQTDTYQPAEFTAWAGLILEQEQAWIDLLLEVDPAALTTIYEKALGRRTGSDKEKQDFLAETHTIVSSAFRMALQSKGVVNFSPILTRVMHTKDLQVPVPPKHETHRYTVAGVTVGLTVVWRECRRQMMSPNWLQVSDIMAEAYPPPEISEMTLLSKGTVLTDRFIEKLINLNDGEEKKLTVPVFSSSPLANFFRVIT